MSGRLIGVTPVAASSTVLPRGRQLCLPEAGVQQALSWPQTPQKFWGKGGALGLSHRYRPVNCWKAKISLPSARPPFWSQLCCMSLKKAGLNPALGDVLVSMVAHRSAFSNWPVRSINLLVHAAWHTDIW